MLRLFEVGIVLGVGLAIGHYGLPAVINWLKAEITKLKAKL